MDRSSWTGLKKIPKKLDLVGLSSNVRGMTASAAVATLGTDGKALDSLPLSAYLVVCEAKARQPWPREKRGQTFRGGHGPTFRKLVCHDISLDCRECPLERRQAS